MSIKYNGKTIAGNYKSQVIGEATEEKAGIIRIATDEEVKAGTDNTTAVTPLELKNSLDNIDIDTSNFVTTNTKQDITAVKTFRASSTSTYNKDKYIVQGNSGLTIYNPKLDLEGNELDGSTRLYIEDNGISFETKANGVYTHASSKMFGLNYGKLYQRGSTLDISVDDKSNNLRCDLYIQPQKLIFKTEDKTSSPYKYTEYDLLHPKIDLSGKQDKLTAGDNITIDGAKISAIVPDISNLATKDELNNIIVKTDNTTIVQNDDKNITAIGVKTKNDIIKYDWIGTLAEYNQGVTDGTIQPNWVCQITDDELELTPTVDVNIPTKISELANDSGFVKKDDIDFKSGLALGQTVFSVDPLTDDRLQLLDGTKILLPNDKYTKFIDKHIKPMLLSNPNRFCTQEEYNTSIETYGVCGKYVYIEDISLQFPKITGFIEGTLDNKALGDITEAGLPNISGEDHMGWYGVHSGIVNNSEEKTGPFMVPTYDGRGEALGGIISGSAATPRGIKFDASKSSPIYGKSNTVQPQSIKGYYYICVATHVTTSIEIANTVEINNANFFGNSMYSSIDPKNISWLKSEGKSISAKPYPSFWNWLITEYNNHNENFVTPIYYQFSTTSGTSFWLTHQNPKVGDKVYGYDPMVECGYVTVVNNDGSVVVKDLKNANKFEYTVSFNTQDKWNNLAIYNNSNNLFDYYFIIDTENNTFKLPLAVRGKRVLVKSYKSESDWYNLYSDGWLEQGRTKPYPQLTGGKTGSSTVPLLYNYNNTDYDAQVTITNDGGNSWLIKVYSMNKETNQVTVNWAAGTGYNITSANGRFNINISGYTDIPVTNLDTCLYFYVGETVVSPNIIDATKILNNRADTSLSNINIDQVSINTELTTLMAHSTMPSTRYIDLTLGASGNTYTYTAPADGWICIEGKNSCFDIYIAGTTFGTNANYINNWYSRINMPIKKDMAFNVYWAGSVPSSFRFYYANGVLN